MGIDGEGLCRHGAVSKTVRATQLAEAQEAKRALERTLERTLEELRRACSDEAAELSSSDEDGAVAQMVAVKERVLSMAYRKLSASKEVILGQQEVIQNLEDNLCQLKAVRPFCNICRVVLLSGRRCGQVV